METLDLKEATPRIQSLLVLGMEGVGKTRFVGTCPKPILLHSFDGGYRTLAGMEGIRCKVFLDKDRRTPVAAREFDAEITKYLNGQEPPYKWADGREEPFKTVALDPLSTWSMLKMHQIQHVNRTSDKKPSWDEYDVLLKAGVDLINNCLQVVEKQGAVLVSTAHLTSDKDEETGQLWFLPDMLGKTRDILGRYFDCVAILKNDKKPDGRVEYQFCTVGERRERARIRIPASMDGVVKPIDVPDFSIIQRRMAERLAPVVATGAVVVVPAAEGGKAA